MRSVGKHLVTVLLLVQAGGLCDDCLMRFGLQQLGYQMLK